MGDESAKPSEDAVKDGKRVFARVVAKNYGQVAGLGKEELDSSKEIVHLSAKVDLDAFLDGAMDTHWSNPDSSTGGMPPENEVELKPTTE